MLSTFTKCSCSLTATAFGCCTIGITAFRDSCSVVFIVFCSVAATAFICCSVVASLFRCSSISDFSLFLGLMLMTHVCCSSSTDGYRMWNITLKYMMLKSLQN